MATMMTNGGLRLRDCPSCGREEVLLPNEECKACFQARAAHLRDRRFWW